jgi:programmed cell death 6-interacting protein
VHNDDISSVLILNKKSIATQDAQIFKAELEKFRNHQSRILQAIHKQKALVKELTRTYDILLQDKRVRSEQSKYESFNRHRTNVLARYKKVYSSFTDLVAGLMRAQVFYSDMKESADSLNKNIVTFVENRRNEGASILGTIEQGNTGGSGLLSWERESVNQLMEKMSLDTEGGVRKSTGSSSSHSSRPMHTPPVPSLPGGFAPQAAGYPNYRPASNSSGPPRDLGYNPSTYQPTSPPANMGAHPAYHNQRFSQQSQQSYQSHPSQAHMSSPPPGNYGGQQPQPQQQQQQQQQSQPPAGWQPPPPPPGPPPKNGQGGGDPWAGLSGWN